MIGFEMGGNNDDRGSSSVRRGVFRPLEPVSLGDREHVYMLVLPEDPTKVAAAQHAALESLIGISESQETEVSTRHDEFLYP